MSLACLQIKCYYELKSHTDVTYLLNRLISIEIILNIIMFELMRQLFEITFALNVRSNFIKNECFHKNLYLACWTFSVQM